MVITLEDFKRRVSLILSREADELRGKYIESFVNTDSTYYREYIAQLSEFTDGRYYTGYLWDTLKNDVLISEADAIAKLTSEAEPLYVFWDLHSAQRIYIENYWKFPKFAVLALSGSDLISGMELLPEDIYVFDGTFRWSIIFTHEYYDAQKRDCREARA